MEGGGGAIVSCVKGRGLIPPPPLLCGTHVPRVFVRRTTEAPEMWVLLPQIVAGESISANSTAYWLSLMHTYIHNARV